MTEKQIKPFPDTAPQTVFKEYERGIRFKNGLGSHGMFEQNKINERFYVGDQWHGARCGNDRPLVRYNVIQRIGKYKMAMVGANPISVNYSADGVPNTLDLRERVLALRHQMAQGTLAEPLSAEEEITLTMSALSDYFSVTAERVKWEDLRARVLLNAYKSGDGVLFTYWDENVRTGLYADERRRCPVTGDIACEVLDIENVYFGDPNNEQIQRQPYILIAQRQSVAALRREARRNGLSAEKAAEIRADDDRQHMAGQYSEAEPPESQKAVVITKLFKAFDERRQAETVYAVRVTRDAVVRPVWDLGVRLYPLARLSWETRRGSAYGESEIPWLIPNQIAINRMITAHVWASMMMGMPIMLVNGDVVTQPVSNDPGQIIRVFGSAQEMNSAVRYVEPPAFSANFESAATSLITNTMTQAGANDAALGDIKPDNAAAIVAVREAATMPLQLIQNRYYDFCEEVARIWAEFWVMKYGRRSLKVEDENGVWYMPFDSDRYQDLLINVKVDVGASTLWSESQSVKTLDNLFEQDVISVKQYLSRLPKGTIPNLNGLLRELQEAVPEVTEPELLPEPADGESSESVALRRDLSKTYPKLAAAFSALDKETQAVLLNRALSGEVSA